ncbi:unnamed protein product [Cercopithifilaria johnstoni]|uniref:Uncharacterized protein n=1 Tax=Cercopithifilaria johnstoni TaxID=2874296 RepID=A0A8J2MA49_9BILA|nr:unnamed protein product [Cercopithifilaria johnstoni]
MVLFLSSRSDVEANKLNASNPSTWLHFVVSIHAFFALSLCIFTVLGYVASIIPMTLVVLFIFQTFMAILGLTAIEQDRQDYRSLYINVNAITTGSAIIWSTFLFINMKKQPIYVPITFLIIALFSFIATILLIFFADKRIPKIFEKVICLNLSPFVKLLCGTKRMLKKANLKKNYEQLKETKEVNSNESLDGSIRSFESKAQQRDSSEMKTGVSVTESVQQHQPQNISMIRNDDYAKGSRIAAGGERNAVETIIKVDQPEKTYNERKNSATLSYVRHPLEGHCLVIGSNWREFYSVPILNACNVALCSTGRIGRNRLRRRLLIKKCRNNGNSVSLKGILEIRGGFDCRLNFGQDLSEVGVEVGQIGIKVEVRVIVLKSKLKLLKGEAK